jgi:hypothetical protein
MVEQILHFIDQRFFFADAEGGGGSQTVTCVEKPSQPVGGLGERGIETRTISCFDLILQLTS